MTPREAAAKCREMAKEFAQQATSYVADMPTFHRLIGQSSACSHAAALIDQIGVPQPWPPPEDNEELALVLAFDSLLKEWRSVECFPNDDWESIDDEEGPFSHWLPMPAAPEVKG